MSAAVVSPLIGLSLDKLKARFSAKSGFKDAEKKINSLSNALVDLFLLMFYIMSCCLHGQFPARNFGRLY